MNKKHLLTVSPQNLETTFGPAGPKFEIERQPFIDASRWMVRLHPEAAGPRIEVKTPRGQWSDDLTNAPRSLRQMLAAHKDKKGVWRSKKPLSTLKTIWKETADVVVRFVRKMVVLILSLSAQAARHVIVATVDNGISRSTARIDVLSASQKEIDMFFSWCGQK